MYGRNTDDLAISLGLPLGGTAAGEPVTVNISDPARGGAGPHGLIQGAEGSGKTSTLVTMISLLCAAYSPQRLMVWIVSPRTNSPSRALQQLPHVTLQPEIDGWGAPVGQAALATITSEMDRRAQLAASGALDAEPTLFVAFDQCDEWVACVEGFAVMLNDMLRGSHRLGIHVLISTQNLTKMPSLPLDTLSYRICHRTMDARSSRLAIGTDEAAWLPVEAPGAALLVTSGTQHVTRFHVQRVDDTNSA
ncbi:FtsK/SpoIIIE domain-containing protein [Mycobacterium adipatum]|uniref:FtsK/SpoIIIE domain-containing protein n=1 Tax=Mycobacterium adipatum TaxID=1682113 RepID=UPI0034E09BA8